MSVAIKKTEDNISSHSSALAHLDLGRLQVGRAQYEEAAKSFLNAATIDPSLRGALGTYWHMKMRMCDWSEYSDMKASINAAIKESESHENTPDVINAVQPFTLFGIQDDSALQLRSAEIYIRSALSSLSVGTKPYFNYSIKKSSDHIKIAFLSSDYHNHATAYLIAELFELIDKERFEIHAISFGDEGKDSVMRQRIQSACCYFHDVTAQTDEEVAKLIAGQEIDIAIDLKGFTQNSRPAILAYKPAPIQISYLGYPGSMGSDFIDYIIADPFIIPKEQQPHYAENIAYLPDSYQINDRLRPIQSDIPSRQSCGLPEDGFVFCCFNSHYKITPEVFDIWMELLKETPRSVLWLLESHNLTISNLKKEAESRGIDPSRLIFADLLRLDYHLARIKNADLFLDTFPCNAHTTASDALWAGLPLLTCSGRSFSARVAGSLLTAIGIPELITHDLDSYKTLALELSQNSDKLNNIKKRLKVNRETCTLFDTVHYKNNLQRLFEHVVEQNQVGTDPETFYVSELANKPQQLLPPLQSSSNKKEAFSFKDTLNTQKITLKDIVEKHISGDIAFAKKGYQAFIDEQHNDVISYSNLAGIYFQENNVKKAIELLRQGVKINPDYIDAQMKLGSMLEILKPAGYLDEVISCYKIVLENNPDHAIACFSLGNAMASQGNNDQAIAYLKNAISLKPDYVLAYLSLGDLLNNLGRLSEASQVFYEAFKADPSLENAHSMYWHLKMHMCDWSEYSVMYTSLQENHKKRKQASGISKVASPFTLLNISDDPELLHETAQQYVFAATTEIKTSPPLFKNRENHSKDIIKIAFLATDYHNHPTSFLVAELFELLDPTLFEVYAITFNRKDASSEIRERIKLSCKYFYDVTEKSDKEIAEFIAELNIDIAIDLKGLTEGCRPGILAYQPAPVQVRFLGFPGTTGADYIDYFIADPVIIPEIELDNYSEKIMYMPDSYQINDRQREVDPIIPSREECGLPENSFIFCCFNHNFKITPQTFDVWMELLKKTDDSILWLLESNQWATENIYKEASARGVDPSRIIFAKQLPSSKHLARIKNADLFLDTFPCNAHTTASDALWVGVPVITCMGRGFSSRVAASILKAVDLEELITTDFDSYMQLALKLSQEPERINQIKSKLNKNRNTCSLFDTHKYTENLQRGFIHMLDLHDSGFEPEDFFVSDLANELIEDLLPKTTTEEHLPISENNTENNNALAINIALIRPQEYKHSDALNEVAESLFHSFNELGFGANITENSLIEDGINIILGSHLLEEQDLELIPQSSILYNFEQITDSSEWMTLALFDLFNKFTVWDYSEKNISALKKRGITKDIQHVPVGYSPVLTRIPKNDIQDIDVLFYGSMNPRRLKILEALTEAGLEVKTLFGVYGVERDEYISRSKVIVNIHYYDSNIFEQVRISYLLANKKAVVSECSDSTEIDEELRDAVALAPYDQIVEKCCDLVRSEESRKALEDKGFEIITSRNTVDYVNNALMALSGEHETADQTESPLKINIGSGKDFKDDYLNIDISENSHPDIIADLSDQNLIGTSLSSDRFGNVIFLKNHFDEIIANDVLEHIPDLVSAMTNCLNLLKVGGEFIINVPYDLSYGAWQDPTHVRAFNERSWLYYTDWFWYLGWDEARFDIKNLDFTLSEIGLKMQQEECSTEQILTQPRAVDSMTVVLTKRLLTDDEKVLGQQELAGKLA